MTEAEWFSRTYPPHLLGFVRDRFGERKFRLFACACARRVAQLIRDHRAAAALGFAERMAERGTAGRKGRPAVGKAVRQACEEYWARDQDALTAAGLLAHLAESNAAHAAADCVAADAFRAAESRNFRSLVWLCKYRSIVRGSSQASHASLVRKTGRVGGASRSSSGAASRPKPPSPTPVSTPSRSSLVLGILPQHDRSTDVCKVAVGRVHCRCATLYGRSHEARLRVGPSGSWPDGAAAAAYLSRAQSLLDAKGLDGSERAVKPLLRKIVSAFRGRDFAGVKDGCDALVDVLSELPAPPAGRPGDAPPPG